MRKYSGKYLIVCGDVDCGAIWNTYDRNADSASETMRATSIKRCPACHYEDFEIITLEEYQEQQNPCE